MLGTDDLTCYRSSLVMLGRSRDLRGILIIVFRLSCLMYLLKQY